MPTLIVWVATVVASVILPRYLFKGFLGNNSKAKE
jgi:hypothetical protein